MRQLSIFDDGERVGTITPIGDNILIFARSVREWRELRRLADSIFPRDSNYLERVAKKAHDYNYSTELINE